MKSVNVHSAARRELAEAMAWYDERCEGLGLDLLAEFQKAGQNYAALLKFARVTNARISASNEWNDFPI